ncbi:MAG: GGDEF domain-containing protein [Rhodospirillaceae bacterium]|nr:GGDEF domain-containing protein [Rhodospirillaceae bacterium]MBT4588592.1 GGDEF domain-containing protein [Rhodospirillaceae bacterium]MBT4937581.1 GGDEF domain-containing protein [Rhodospirillaceae bacterium]MBT5940035.1 GGDEF domain-containing protein [Rhodospirillaceae bacterium]MBT7266303.1 GGDEF domain-containing protein [Rhodospirillaceae bacterium]
MITNLVVERSLRNKEGRKNNDKKGHLNQIADIARRFCALSSNKVASEIAEITNEHELLEAMSTMLAENASLRDKMDEQACRIAYLEELATSDELTGVLNRRGFEAELKRVLARAKRDIEQGILVYIDLDEFKPINDTHGHAAGDEVLRKVAAILNEMTRDMDVIGRLGGDEFAIILVNTNQENGLKRAETLNTQLNATRLPWNGQELTIQASFGMQSYRSGDNAQALLNSADAAMYKIKQIKEEDGQRHLRSMALKRPSHPPREIPRLAGNAQII